MGGLPVMKPRCPLAFGADQLGQRLGGAFQFDLLDRLLPTPLDLQLAIFQAALADYHPQRNADQVGVLELHARPAVTIVQQHVDPRGSELIVQLPGNLHRRLVVAL